MYKHQLIIVIFLLFFIVPIYAKENFKTGTIRGLADTIGFSYSPEQIKAIVQLSEDSERERMIENDKKNGVDSSTHWIAGICPHDDHLLAGRVYVHLFQHLRAKQIIIFGVAHKAWKWGIRDSLIFDAFDFWRGPYGQLKVSALREEIIRRLPADDYIVNNHWQSEEHSVEGIVPFIQHYIPDAEIVSILVPYMNWERLDRLSRDLAEVLQQIVTEKHWILGKDIAVICSNDGDHYGDQDWGDKNLAPFGADEQGYLKATRRDADLIQTTLVDELKPEKLKNFTQLVWGDDLLSYKITWCGRFAIPCGLNCVYHLAERLKIAALTGYLLRYDTSYHSGKLNLPDIGLGTTAPNNIHHWVGYSAIGYK